MSGDAEKRCRELLTQVVSLPDWSLSILFSVGENNNEGQFERLHELKEVTHDKS